VISLREQRRNRGSLPVTGSTRRILFRIRFIEDDAFNGSHALRVGTPTLNGRSLGKLGSLWNISHYLIKSKEKFN
jgi:hypothetical protein